MQDFTHDFSSATSPQHFSSFLPKVRLALQGGGALGAYGAGVLQSIDEAGVQASVGSGLSAGAINLYTYMHAGADGLEALWDRIGRDGDKARQVKNNPLTMFMPESYLISVFRLSGLSTPLDYLRSAVADSISTHGLAHKKLEELHISTVTKIDPRKDLHPENVKEVIHSGADHHLDVPIASGALSALTELEPSRTVEIRGEPHWDGAYSGKNPNLSVFMQPSRSPLIVVSVDEPELRQSITDPHIQYGQIHEDVARFKAMDKCPVYHVTLEHREHWSKRVRTQPTSALTQELREIGREDGAALVQQMMQDYSPTIGNDNTHDRAVTFG